jgi:hypothetical protein
MTMCQTCRWLGGLSRQQARKLAVAHAKEAARAAKAARAAAGGDNDDDDLEDGSDNESEGGEDEVEDNALVAENEEDIADAAGEPLVQRRDLCVALEGGVREGQGQKRKQMRQWLPPDEAVALVEQEQQDTMLLAENEGRAGFEW